MKIEFLLIVRIFENKKIKVPFLKGYGLEGGARCAVRGNRAHAGAPRCAISFVGERSHTVASKKIALLVVGSFIRTKSK